jgi:SAM-dependent methyltransferase
MENLTLSCHRRYARSDILQKRLQGYSVDSAEFDRFADEYDQMLRQSVSVTGESPEFFHEYKIRVLSLLVQKQRVAAETILDFGSGVGNSTPYLRKYFPQARLSGADVSERSLEVAGERFPGDFAGLRIEDNRVPAPDGAFDIAFSACVFHHIPHDEHVRWLRELRRVTRVGGMLTIFEHNPLNPLTVRAVSTCPFDGDAHLLRAGELMERCEASGWGNPMAQYHLFFPHLLSGLRVFEPYLSSVPFGGQYLVSAMKLG